MAALNKGCAYSKRNLYGIFYLADKTPDSCPVMDRPSEGHKPKACVQRNRLLLSAETHYFIWELFQRIKKSIR